MTTSITITTIICITILGVVGFLCSVARKSQEIESNKITAEITANILRLKELEMDGETEE